MAHTRTLTGIIHKPTGEPWAGFALRITLTPAIPTAHAMLPSHALTIATDNTGTYAVDLEVNATYLVEEIGSYNQQSGSATRYPTGSRYTIVMPDGETPVSLEMLRASEIVIPPGQALPDVVQAIADDQAAHEANHANPHQVTAAQLTDFDAEVTASPTVAGHTSALAILDGRADGVDAALVGLDSRLDAAEPLIASNTATLSAHTSELADHEARVTAAEGINTSQGQRLDLVQYRKPTIAALGDSITSNGVNNLGAGPRNWLMHACIASGGKMHWSDNIGGGGYKTAQILSDLVPALLNRVPRPGYCAVLAGANDTNVTSFVSWSADYTAILDALADAGIMPIICPITPNDTTSKHADAAKFNGWLNLEARRRGIPYADWLPVLMDPATGGSWLGSLPTVSSDGTHPEAATAKVMGDALWAALQPWFAGQPIWTPYLAISNTDPTNLHSNGLFLTDSNADGAADNVAAIEGGAGVWSDYITSTLENPSSGDCVGKWQSFQRIATGAPYAYWFGNVSIPVTPGDRIALALRLKATSLTSSAVPMGQIGLYQYNSTTVPVGLVDGAAGSTGRWWTNGWVHDIPAMTIYQELVVRPGSSNTRFIAQLGANATAGKISFAQLTIRNLTALGLA